MVEGKEDKSEVSDLTGAKKAHICIGDQLPCYADKKLHAGELYYYPDFNPFDGSIEVKEVNGTRYIYARKREAGRNTSTYLGVYSDERYDALRSDTDFYIRRPERYNTVYERKMLETVLG